MASAGSHSQAVRSVECEERIAEAQERRSMPMEEISQKTNNLASLKKVNPEQQLEAALRKGRQNHASMKAAIDKLSANVDKAYLDLEAEVAEKLNAMQSSGQHLDIANAESSGDEAGNGPSKRPRLR